MYSDFFSTNLIILLHLTKNDFLKISTITTTLSFILDLKKDNIFQKKVDITIVNDV